MGDNVDDSRLIRAEICHEFGGAKSAGTAVGLIIDIFAPTPESRWLAGRYQLFQCCCMLGGSWWKGEHSTFIVNAPAESDWLGCEFLVLEFTLPQISMVSTLVIIFPSYGSTNIDAWRQVPTFFPVGSEIDWNAATACEGGFATFDLERFTEICETVLLSRWRGQWMCWTNLRCSSWS